jgi:hypothetical protein
MRTSHIFLRQGVVDVAVLAIVKIGEGVRMTGVMVITTESEVGPTKIPTLAEAEAEDVVADVVVAAAVAAAEMVAVMVAAVAVTVVAEAEDAAAEESQDSIVTIVHQKVQVVVVDVAEITNVPHVTITIENLVTYAG